MKRQHTLSRMVFGLTVLAGTTVAGLLAQPAFIPGLHAPAVHGAINPQPLPPEGRS